MQTEPAGKNGGRTFLVVRGRERLSLPNVCRFSPESWTRWPAEILWVSFQRHAVVDALGYHNGVYLGNARDRIFAACCNSHARRKFVGSEIPPPPNMGGRRCRGALFFLSRSV